MTVIAIYTTNINQKGFQQSFLFTENYVYLFSFSEAVEFLLIQFS